MTELAGKRLGEFEIVRELGRGGMGVVYEAMQLTLNRRVALKVLGAGLGLTPRAVERFHREAEAAAKLHHTNIVPVYATGEEAGLHFYAMELIDGPSLDRVIIQLREQRGGMANTTPSLAPELTTTGPYLDTSTPTGSGVSSGLSSGSGYFDAVGRMIADVADALHHAHQNNVIHRDIKPGNLLLGADGRLSINDFGLARALEEPGMTTTGEFVGTPAYMSPEQIAGGRVPVDHRCDIYSLGATLYELLTLRPPFVAAQRDQLLAMVTQKEPPSPHSLNPKIPRDLETICLKCLEKDPDRRYPTAKDLADDLRRYVNRFAILAKRAGPLAKAVKWVKRNPALSAAVVAVFLCAGVAAGLAYRVHLRDVAHQRELDEIEQERLEENRRRALEKAILSARVEDFEEARQAIREAEELGCSPGQLQMLRGQLELSQGHTKEALEYLKQAAESLPESVAARSLLAGALQEAGQLREHYRVLGEALRMKATTPEDFLFQGYATSVLDPDRGLTLLDDAVKRRPTVLAQLIRLNVLRLGVLDKPDLEKVNLVMEDIRSIQRLYPDNVTVLILSTAVHTTCYDVLGELQQPALQKVALDEGQKSAQALARFPDSVKAKIARWLFLDETGQGEAGFAELRRSWESTKDLYLAYYYATYLYRLGDMRGALAVLEFAAGENVVDLFRVFFLAELSPDGLERAHELYREVAARDLGDWDLFNSQLILRFLGRKDEAVEVSRKFLTRSDRFPPVRQEAFRRALEYCAGQLSAGELIADLRGSRGDLSNAYLCIALTALADRDRAKARRYFELCRATRFYERIPYDLSKMFLSRLDADPNWPPWIQPRNVAPMPRLKP